MAKTLEKYDMDWDFKVKKGMPGYINKKNFPVPFFSIIGLFAEDANYELRECYVDRERLFISGYTKGESNTLMLRYNCGENNNLVVARVEFIHKRKGKMTELYRILKKIRRKYHTGPIMIESVMTEEMKEWCLKNNFYEDKCMRRCFFES